MEQPTHMPPSAPTDPPPATLEFLTGWRTLQHGTITPGGQLIIWYDPQRLPRCRLTWRGAEVWDIEVSVRFHPNGSRVTASTLAKVRTPPETGIVTQLIPQPVTLTVPPDAVEVELWFRNFYDVSSHCAAWDSQFGQNYWYPVLPTEGLPASIPTRQ